MYLIFKAGAVSLLIIISTAVLAEDAPFILGADISWIPERESYGVRYVDNGDEKDILEILKEHRFNWIRLRLFVDPTAEIPGEPESPYSTEGFCDLAHTLHMAHRIKDAGFKFLLDFHYSDTWADPAKQYKPQSWESLSFEQLTQKVRSYTRETLEQFESEGLLPDMVQVGNEIVGGMIWPDGRLSDMGNFAALVNAGIDGVKDVDEDIKIMIHTISENSPSWWLSNLMNAGVTRIDVLGLSYYSEWHGTPDELEQMIKEIARDHTVKIAIAEYADNHERVNDIVYNLPDDQGIGTFVWEPADWMEALFDWRNGRRETNDRIDLYPRLSAEYGNDDVHINGDINNVSMRNKKTGDGITISPNGTLYFNVQSSDKASITLLTLHGRIMSRWQFSGLGRHHVPLRKAGFGQVSAGNYILVIDNDNTHRSSHMIQLFR